MLARFAATARRAQAAGLGVNAGHDLSQANLGAFLRRCPNVLEVSIGHALIGEALYAGLEATVRGYLAILKPADRRGATGFLHPAPGGAAAEYRVLHARTGWIPGAATGHGGHTTVPTHGLRSLTFQRDIGDAAVARCGQCAGEGLVVGILARR